MAEIKRDPHLDPNQLISSDMLPRLALLTRELPALFAAKGERDGQGLRDNGEIEPVTPVEWMNQLAEVTRAYEAAHQLVQSQDELLGQTLASFGRL